MCELNYIKLAFDAVGVGVSIDGEQAIDKDLDKTDLLTYVLAAKYVS